MLRTFFKTTLPVIMVALFATSVTCGLLAYRIRERHAVQVHRGSEVSRRMRPPLPPEEQEKIHALTAASIAGGLGSIGLYVLVQRRSTRVARHTTGGR